MIGGLNVHELQEAITCFIAAGSLPQLSKGLSVNSSRPVICRIMLAVTATFPIREKFTELGAPFAPTKYLTNRCLILCSSIPSRNVFVDEQVISLRTRSSFPLSILCALYIIYFIIHIDARNLLGHGKVVVAF